MNLDMEDGRVLELPDEMSDESARQFKRLILASEERARAAETQVRQLQDEMAAMRQTFAQARVDASAHEMTTAAVRELVATVQKQHGEHLAALQSIKRATSADRVLIQDELGTHRSRIA